MLAISLFGHKSVLTQTDISLYQKLKALQNQQKSVLTQIELLELDKSGIHVVEYLTVLPLKELLQAKLQQAIASTRRRLPFHWGTHGST